MIRRAISVEGQTEEAFIKDVLAAPLRQRDVEPVPVVIGKARNKNRGGGNVTIDRLVSDMVNLGYSHDAVTSLVDFYGFKNRPEETVCGLEKHLLRNIESTVPDARRFIPYVQKYEFESILFSDVSAFGVTGPGTDPAIEQLRSVRQEFGNPEEINDDPNGAPSKRIEQAMSGYRKRLHGPMVAQHIGLARIRAECPRFNRWLCCIERLSGQ